MEDHKPPIQATVTLDLSTPEGRAAMKAITHLHDLSSFVFEMRYNFARRVGYRLENGEGALEAVVNEIDNLFEAHEPPKLLE